MQKVVNFVRNGERPALVEFFTYRHREHCGPFFDDNLNYRATREVNSWLKRILLQLWRNTSTEKK